MYSYSIDFPGVVRKYPCCFHSTYGNLSCLALSASPSSGSQKYGCTLNRPPTEGVTSTRAVKSLVAERSSPPKTVSPSIGTLPLAAHTAALTKGADTSTRWFSV